MINNIMNQLTKIFEKVWDEVLSIDYKEYEHSNKLVRLVLAHYQITIHANDKFSATKEQIEKICNDFWSMYIKAMKSTDDMDFKLKIKNEAIEMSQQSINMLIDILTCLDDKVLYHQFSQIIYILCDLNLRYTKYAL